MREGSNFKTSFYLLSLNYVNREYFESRAAAQAVKAKVEAYERGGFSNNNPQQGKFVFPFLAILVIYIT
jgi:hypothetical protein